MKTTFEYMHLSFFVFIDALLFLLTPNASMFFFSLLFVCVISPTPERASSAVTVLIPSPISFEFLLHLKMERREPAKRRWTFDLLVFIFVLQHWRNANTLQAECFRSQFAKDDFDLRII